MSHWETAGASNDWYTPPHVFAALGCSFDLDVAHPSDPTHVPARNWFTEMDDGLRCNWRGFVWMNPPFGTRNGLAPWLDRFFAHGNGIALVPDRTSAPWFQDAWRRADLALFTRKLRFLRPDGSEGVSPSNGTALMAAGDKAAAALRRAQACGLGILAAPVPGGQLHRSQDTTATASANTPPTASSPSAMPSAMPSGGASLSDGSRSMVPPDSMEGA